MSPSRHYQAPLPYISAAMPIVDLPNEDVLAPALVGEGAATVALEHGHNLQNERHIMFVLSQQQ